MSNSFLLFYRMVMAMASLYIIHNFFNIYYISKKNKYEFIIWIPYLFLQVGSGFFSDKSPFLFLTCNIFFNFIVLNTNYKGSKIKKVLLCIAIQTVGGIIEISISFIFNLLKINSTLNYYLGTTLSNIIMFTIVLFLKPKNILGKVHRYWTPLLLMPIGSIIIAYNIYILNKTNQIQIILSLISYSLIFMINLTVFEVYNKLTFEHREEFENYVLEQQATMNVKHIEEIDIANQNIRILEHDLKNHLISIHELLKRGAISEAQKYITSLPPFTPPNNTLHLNSGNPVIESIIQTKFSIAKKNNIVFHLSVFIPEHLPVDNKTISIILGNSLDNALEAAYKCKVSFIKLSLLYKKGSLLISIANSYIGELKRNHDGELISTKDNSTLHGLGIKSIKKSIEPYDGELIIKTTNETFTMLILLNLEIF